MRVFSYLSFAICTVGVVSGLGKSTQPVELSTSLKLRGGAGPLNQATVAKVAVTMLGVEGLMGVLFPEAITGKGFGLAVNDQTVITAKGIGFADLTIVAGASQLFFQEMDLKTIAIDGGIGGQTIALRDKRNLKTQGVSVVRNGSRDILNGQHRCQRLKRCIHNFGGRIFVIQESFVESKKVAITRRGFQQMEL